MRSTFKLLYFVKRNAVKKNGNAPIIARITIDQVVFSLSGFVQLLGDPPGARTQDPNIKSVVLYLLS